MRQASLPRLAGPVAPTPTAMGVLRPLSTGVRFDPSGLLGRWQRRNGAETLPHCHERLESDGSLENLHRVASGGEGEHRGMWFSDSDVYKTLEASVWEAARQGSGTGALTDFVERTAALLSAAQEDDGYLNSFFTGKNLERRWENLAWSHELYCAGHLIQAAVAAARAEVGSGLVAVARRTADLLVRRFGADGVDGVCGHPEIETALVELFRLTGHHPYLALANRFLTLRGHGLLARGPAGRPRFGLAHYQDDRPIRESDQVSGHAVRQLYLLAGAVDVAVETADVELLAAVRRLWDDAFGTKTYLTGGHGSRHRDESFGDPYELPPDRAYAESCAAVASFHWNWRLLLATGEVRYADELERVLYNGVAVAIGADGRHFFYSNPLQLRRDHDGSDEDAPSARLPWYSCACCPPNLARLMASLHHYAATTSARGIELHLYSGGRVVAEVGASSVTLDVRTRYPWAGRVEITIVDTPVDRSWTLALRTPGWCRRFAVTVDGRPLDVAPDGGYVHLTRPWTPGTRIVLDLEMTPRLVAGHPRIDAVRGCVALQRGPLVYCFEEIDLPAGTALEDVRLDDGCPVRVEDHGDDAPVPTTLGLTGHTETSPTSALYLDHRPESSHHDRSPSPRPGDEIPLTALPYFLWGNRASPGMRVWMPIGRP